MKVAFGGIHIESSTFTSYRSSYNDFLITEDLDLLKRYPFLKNYKEVTPIPLIHARALPGGIVDRVFFDDFINRFLEKLKSNIDKLDGLFLDLHGAMTVEGLDDAEGYFASKVRETVGDSLLITTSMDLHGSVSDMLFYTTDVITCYKTAPHIDVIETRERALVNLIKLFKYGRKYYFKTKVDVPILLSGEMTSTETYPGNFLYSKINIINEHKKILDSSIFMGFPWADLNRSHGYTLAYGFDDEVVSDSARFLADTYIDLKDEFKFVGPAKPLNETINDALKFNDNLFFISDTGDNPGAGGSGDLTIVLNEFLKIKTNKKILFASIKDEIAINDLYKNKIGDKTFINLGSKIDPKYSNPTKIEVEIISFGNDIIPGKICLVKHNDIFIIITENRFQFGTIQAFKKSNINDLSFFDIIVVKMGYLEPDLNKIKKGWTMALTNGAVNQDLLSSNYKNLKKNIFPFKKDNISLRIIEHNYK